MHRLGALVNYQVNQLSTDIYASVLFCIRIQCSASVPGYSKRMSESLAHEFFPSELMPPAHSMMSNHQSLCPMHSRMSMQQSCPSHGMSIQQSCPSNCLSNQSSHLRSLHRDTPVSSKSKKPSNVHSSQDHSPVAARPELSTGWVSSRPLR